MNELTFYLPGGAALNIGSALKQKSRSQANREATYVGLDSSGANDVGGLFPVERMPAAEGNKMARGSGKVKLTNYPKAEPFVEEVLSKHKPSSFNIVVCSAAGGTGSMLGVLLVRRLIEMNKPVVILTVSDHTSQKEMENSVGTLRSLAAQTEADQLNKPIAFINVVNDNNHTRGEINATIIHKLDLLSMFLTEQNEEVDYEDIANMLTYSKTCKVPPALSEINFYDEKSARSYTGKPPVAVCSLFGERDAVVPLFEGSVYRATGVYNPNFNRPGDVEEMHMTLDHGEALERLKDAMENLQDRRVTTNNKFTEVESVSQGANNKGMFLD